MRTLHFFFPLCAALLASPALAGSSCTLTLNSTGTLAMDPTGTVLASQASGGSAATMAVVAVLTRPTLVFSAPTVLGPTGWSASPSTYLAWDTLSGVHQGYTSGATTVQLSGLADTVTLNAAVQSTTGFKAGTYTVSTTVTCQQ